MTVAVLTGLLDLHEDLVIEDWTGINSLSSADLGATRTVWDGAVFKGDLFDALEDEGGVIGLGHGAEQVQGGRLLRLAGLLRGTADSAGPGPHDPGR